MATINFLYLCTDNTEKIITVADNGMPTTTVAEAQAAILNAPAATQFVSMGAMDMMVPKLAIGLSESEGEMIWKLLLSDRHVDLSVLWAVNYGFPTSFESHVLATDADKLACLQRVYHDALQKGYLERRTQSGSTQRWTLPYDVENTVYKFHGVATCARLAEEHPPDQSWMTTPYKLSSLFVPRKLR